MHQPDFAQFLKVLRREKPDRPVLFETYIDWTHIRQVLGGDMRPQDDPPWGWIWNQLDAFARCGYDVSPIGLNLLTRFEFSAGIRERAATISQNEGAVITDQKSLEQYRWPDPAAGDYMGFLDNVAPGVPKGMKLLLSSPGGVLENLIFLVGYENLCYLMADQPDLIQRISDEIGSRSLAYLQRSIRHDLIGGILIMDDWGYKTGTMVSPDQFRRYIFPWHRAFVRAAHDLGKPAILHACGNCAVVMDEIIDDLKYDAKHSWEDVILPVEKAWDQYHHRIAILGGLDVDFLSRSTPDQVYARAKALVDKTHCEAYALGSGNSITNYVHPEIFQALLRAAQ